MFVIVLSEGGIFQQIIASSEMADAMDTARERVESGYEARVYNLPNVSDARAAKAAVEMGDGTLIAIPSRKPSSEELAARKNKQVQEQRKKVVEQAAAWQVVRERFVEHNALVDANKPGYSRT
jgi:hypothetical protein